jgi:uncharacterized protein YerC
MSDEAASLLSIEAAVAALRDTTEAGAFLAAILSPSEYDHIRRRWLAFQLKLTGFTHRAAARRVGISMETVSRVAALQRIESPILEHVLSRCQASDLGPLQSGNDHR